MLSALHLLWIVPVCVMAGVFLTALIARGDSGDDVY